MITRFLAKFHTLASGIKASSVKGTKTWNTKNFWNKLAKFDDSLTVKHVTCKAHAVLAREWVFLTFQLFTGEAFSDFSETLIYLIFQIRT